jgi:hypothetical protein
MAKKKTVKTHKRPTVEELEEKIKEVENIDLEEEVVEPETSEPTPSEPEEEPPEPEPSKEIIKDVLKREKEKNVASSKEAQVLHAKNKKLTEAIEIADDIPDPTEEEMQVEYTDWDVMSDFEKKIAKDNLISKRRFQTISQVTKEFKDLDAWQAKVEKFVDNPEIFIKYPSMEGKEEEFKSFAMKPTRRGVDFDDLVPAFLYHPDDTPKPKSNKGGMFETGTGGPSSKPNPVASKISIEDAAKIRETNFKKYKELLMAGRIAVDL